jgi:cobalt-zinc-cadmium resistance protein CzcA
MAAYGVTIADAQAVLEMAFGGKTATQKYEEKRKFDVRVRYEKSYRKDEEDMANLKVPTLSGAKVPLKNIADIRKITGPAFIYRDDTKRFIGVKFSVRESK